MNAGTIILELVCRLLLDTTYAGWMYVVTGVLWIAGLWMLLEKSGVRGWWALVPFARSYKLGQCADREKEGRVLVVIEALSLLLSHLCLWGIRGFVARMGIVLSAVKIYPLEWVILLAVFLLSILPTLILTRRMAHRDGMEA